MELLKKADLERRVLGNGLYDEVDPGNGAEVGGGPQTGQRGLPRGPHGVLVARRLLGVAGLRQALGGGVLQALRAQPNGDEAVAFKRTNGGDDWIRFENKEHDYPQRIEYRKSGDGLHAEIGGPGAGGKEEVISYDYTRCK